MLNSRRITIVAFLGLFLLLANSSSHPTSGSFGYTAAPNDGVCSQCHTGVNPNLDGELTITGIPAIVEPNSTHLVEIELTNPNGNAVRGGFQLLALDGISQAGDWANQSAGSIIKILGGGMRQYLGHQGQQNFDASNTLSWTAEWTAPDVTTETEVDFWGVAIIGNGGNGNSNDRFRNTQFMVTVSPTTTDPLEVTLDGTEDVSCFGEADGSATISISGGQPDYTISWDNGESTTTATMLDAGIHNVTVTDNNGTTAELSLNIGSPDELILNLDSTTDVSCPDGVDGSATVSATGGSAPYNFSWSNGATGMTANDLSEGNYIVTVTDANDCTTTLSVEIGAPEELFIIVINNASVSCNGGSDGSIQVSADGGTPGYSYSWSTGAVGNQISGVAAGVYEVSVVDANGCLSTLNIEVTEPEALFLVPVANDPLCTDESTGWILVNVEGGTSPYSYLWSNGSTESMIIDLSAGDYTITVTDQNGCTASTTIMLSNPPMLDISTVVIVNPTCDNDNNGSIEVFPQGGTGVINFNWSDGENTNPRVNLAEGEYSLTVTDENGCTAATSYILEDQVTLSLSTSSTPETNPGAEDGTASVEVVSGGSAPYDILWSNGSTTATITNLAAGSYMVTVTDANGCTAMGVASVASGDCNLILEVTPYPLSCFASNDGAISSTVSNFQAPLSYLWSNGATADSIGMLSAGEYALTVSDAAGCSAFIHGILISEPSELNTEIEVISSAGCSGEAHGALTAITTGGTSPYILNWSNGETADTISGLVESDYTVTVTDGNGCTASDASFISAGDDEAPILVLQDLTLYVAEDGTWPDLSIMDFDNGSSDNCSSFELLYEDEPIITCDTLGTQMISIVGVDVLGNQDTADVTLTLLDTIPPTIISCPSDINLTSCQAITFDFPVAMDNCSEVVILNQVSGPESGSVFPTGLSDIAFEISDDSGNISICSFTITVESDLDILIEINNPLCAEDLGSISSISLSGIHDPYLSDSSILTQEFLPGTYFYSVEDTVGCILVDSFTIIEPSSIEILEISTSPASTNASSDGSIEISIEGATLPIAYSLFDEAGNLIQSQDTTLFTDIPTGLYTIVATDANGCSVDTDAIFVDFLTSTNDWFDELGATIYPSPVVHDLYVDITHQDYEGQMEIRSIEGHLLSVYDLVSGSNRISVDHLASGMYIVVITDQGRRASRRIAIQD